MKITKKNIEKLGFTFKLKDEETNSDYTFNKPSDKEGWIDLLVWHPETNNIILSQHTHKLFDLNKTGLNHSTNIEDYITRLFDLNFVSMSQLENKLKDLNIIK